MCICTYRHTTQLPHHQSTGQGRWPGYRTGDKTECLVTETDGRLTTGPPSDNDSATAEVFYLQLMYHPTVNH